MVQVVGRCGSTFVVGALSTKGKRTCTFECCRAPPERFTTLFDHSRLNTDSAEKKGTVHKRLHSRHKSDYLPRYGVHL